jgi:site-specific DNA-cytosine methylase
MSYPKLFQKGCKLLLSKQLCTLTIPEVDGHGEGFDVPVFCADGEMPYVAPIFVGSSEDAQKVYDAEVRKTHWHLNAIDARPSAAASIDSGLLQSGVRVEVTSASSGGVDVSSAPMPVGTRTRAQVINAAHTVVSKDMLAQIMQCTDIGIISVGAGGLDGFVTAGRVFGVHILGGFEKHQYRKKLHERFHGVQLGHDAKFIPAQYLQYLDSRAAELGVKRRVGIYTLPCQPYSTAGKMRGAADSRAFTVQDVLTIHANVKGDALIFENVGSTPQHHLAALQAGLEELGYHVSQCRRDASVIGNAQVRTRVFLCAIQGGPISIQKMVPRKLKCVAVGTLLDDVPSEDVFVDFDFELTDEPRVHDNKPTLMARFRGWEKVRSHWPGLGFSIHSVSGRAATLRAMTMPRREDQPAGPRGTVLWQGRPRGITVREACRIQGFSELWLEGIDDITATELIGEAVCVEHGGSILAEVLVAMFRAQKKQGPSRQAVEALEEDMDTSAPADMIDRGARAKFRVRTSHRGISREQAHRRWGHCGRDMLNMLPYLQQFVPHTHYYKYDDWHCEACELAMNIANPKPVRDVKDNGRRRIRTTKVGELVHIDPMAKQRAFSLEGHLTAMVIIDDFSRFPVVELLLRKGDLKEAFCKFCIQYYKPKRVRCDNEVADMLRAICKDKGIILEPIVPNVAHQNGTVEKFIGLLQQRARTMRMQSQVPEAFNLHAVAYAAQMMRFLPQAGNDFKTPYELANGYPHRKPGPIQAVFGCLVYVVDTRIKQLTNKLSKRTMKGVFMGLGSHERLDSNCRAVRVFCLERNALILSDPLHVTFFNDIFPFAVMRMKAPYIDDMIRVRLQTEKSPMMGAVVAFDAPLYTIVLEDGRLVRARTQAVYTWIESYRQRNKKNNKPNVPVVQNNHLSRWELGTSHLVASIAEGGDSALRESADSHCVAVRGIGSTRTHVHLEVSKYGAKDVHQHDDGRGWRGRIHMVGDTVMLPPGSASTQVIEPFIGSVVSAWLNTSCGRRTLLRNTELGDATIRAYDSQELQEVAALVQHPVQRHTLEHYAQATGQDVQLVRTLPAPVISLAFSPQSESNVLAWSVAEYAQDGAYDTLVDIDANTMREFDKPPDVENNVASVDGFIRSMDEAARENQQHDIHREPQNDRQAEKSDFRDKWAGARDKETDALMRNKVIAADTATRAEIGRGKVLSMKWVYKIKSDGTFKARLVIRGFTQREGDNTYDKDMVLSPTAHGPSVRILLASAVQLGRHVGTFDVANAFQQGEFIAGEVIFVRMPKNAGGDVRRLLTPLYGLKQSARSFNEKLTSVLTRQLGFVRAYYESSLYTYEEVNDSGNTQRLDILVHVDDGLYSTTCLAMKDRKFAELQAELQFTDECELRTYLGVDYTYDRDKGICTASSEGYFRRSFQRLHLGFMLEPDFASSVRDIPFAPDVNLSNCDDDELYEEGTCPINMRVIVGVLSYAASTTRPDLSYIVNVLASCVSAPRPKHVKAAYHVMAYIAGTLDMGIVYSRKKTNDDNDWRLEAFSDADWASETTSRRSRTGIILMMCGAPMLWKSHLQATISLSTTEAEYNALVYMGCETLYFFRLLADLGQRAIVEGVKSGGAGKAMPIRVDNKSTLRIAENPFNMRRTRHIEIRHMKVLEWVKAGLISLVYVPSADNIADIFTKASKKQVFTSNRDSILSRVGPLATTVSNETGLVSYDAGEFSELAGVKPAVSSVSEQRTSVSAVMSRLYQQIAHDSK